MNDNTSGLGFGQFVPGFEFLQKLVNPTASTPGQSSWVAPTFNVEDLEKRIEELKAVHFWLEQNSKALSATIQAMEVQKMTLATLRDLNVNFGDMAKASEAVNNAAAETVAKGFAGFDMPSAAAPQNQKPDSSDAQPDKIDPVQWWGALQQQFQNIAVNAMQNLSQQNAPAAAKKTAPTRKKPVASKKTAASKKAPTRSRAR